MTKPLLTFALALGLAPAATAQTDADPGGAPPAPPAAPAVAVDDRDPGGAPPAASPAPPAADDRDDAWTPSLGAPVVRVDVTRAPLDNGRSDAAPALRVAPVVDAPLDHGRAPGAAPRPGRASAVPYRGPLDNGRGDAERPAVAEVSDPPSPAPGSAKTGAPASDVAFSSVMPNPVRGRAAITFRVPETTDVTLVLYDLTGRRVATAFDAQAQPGQETRVELDLSRVAAGTYVAVLDTGRERLSRTFQVVR